MNKASVITTHGGDSSSIASLCSELEGAGIETEHEELFFKSAVPGPEYVEIIADVLTWGNIFKVAATAFFAKLGQEAATDLWKHKKDVANALSSSAVRPIRDIAKRLFQVQENSVSGTNISLAIPVPSDFPATAITFVAQSETEVSVYLACFTLKVESIADAIIQFEAKGRVEVISVQLELLDNGQFKLVLNDVINGKSSNVIV